MLSLFQMKQILHPVVDSTPEDDFRILDSWAEYKESSDRDPEKRNLDYLCYEMEVMNPMTGERTHCYKAIKLARVVRLPADAKQSTALMDMQEQILTAVNQQNINLITIIANVIKPVAVGLLYLYGVQGVASSIDRAKDKAKKGFLSFIYSMQGTFRVLELRCANAEETEWLREKMYNMDYLTVVRGIPKANKAGENMGNKGMGGSNVNPDSQGTLEEIITGMADYEYVIQILSTPVYTDTLMSWQRQSQIEMSDWYGQLQGTKSLSMNLSIPMMYMANASQSQGWSKAYTDANTVSYAQGESFTTSQGQSVGESLSQTFGQSYGHSEGQSLSNSYSQGVSHTQGVSYGETFGHSVGQNSGFSINQSQGVSSGSAFGQNQGISSNIGSSVNQGVSENTGISHGKSSSVSQGLSHSFGTSQSQGMSQSTNISQGHSTSQGNSYNMSYGQNVSQSHSVGNNQSFGWNQSQSMNRGQSASFGQSSSESMSQGTNSSYGFGQSDSYGQSHSGSSTYGQSFNVGHSSSTGMSLGISGGLPGGILNANAQVNASNSDSSSIGESSSNSVSNGVSSSHGSSFSSSVGSSVSNGVSHGQSTSIGSSLSYGSSVGQSGSVGASESYGTNIGQSLSQGWGASQSVSDSYSIGNGISQSQTQGISESSGLSQSQGYGESSSLSQSLGTSNSYGMSYGNGASSGVSASQNVGQSASLSYGQNFGQSESYSASQNFGRSESVGTSETFGQSVGQTVSNSVSNSASTGYGQNVGRTESVSNGQSYTTSNGSSQGTSNGTTGTTSLGTSSSMGLGPSIGYSKSYQWLDQGVKDLLELMEFQNERIKKALRGQGAFYTYVYIACPTADALSVAQAVAKSTWQNEFAMTNPIQVLNLTESEQRHLLYHFAAFSADVTREDVFGTEEYKYCTVLLPEEYVAYTHLPRISEGGVFATVQDIPKFAAPSGMKGDIYMGVILNAERYTFEHGYRTAFDYRIDENQLMHGFFTGASRSGKTVAAMRFIAELSKVRRAKTGKRLRIVVMDPKQDWRTLARFIEPERFNFYSMGNPTFQPIHINPWKVPKGVYPQIWIDGVINIYCRAYGLLERGKQMISDVVYELYKEAGVFEVSDKENWKEEVPERSSQINFQSIYNRMEEKRDQLVGAGKSGNDTKDAYARLIERLSCFSRPYSIESKLYGTSDGIAIDDLIGADDVTVLESKGLENTFKNFIFGVITSGFFKFALAHEGGYLADDQYETVLVLEEANEVLTGSDTAGTGGGSGAELSGQSEFEQILDQSAGYGLFIFAITQKIADMPSSVIANSGLVFAGRLKRADDINVVVRTIGREERIDDRDIVKWFPRSPTGWFVCQTSRTFDFKDAEPILVQISRLNIHAPSNAELDEILIQKKIAKVMSA